MQLKHIKIGGIELMPRRTLTEQDTEWTIKEKQYSCDYDFINKFNCFLSLFVSLHVQQ